MNGLNLIDNAIISLFIKTPPLFKFFNTTQTTLKVQ